MKIFGEDSKGMKEQRFEKVVEWERVEMSIIPAIMCWILSLIVALYTIYPANILCSFFILSAWCVACILIHRKVYYRRIKA